MSCQLHSHLPKKESKRQETTTLKSYHQLTSVVDTSWHQQLTGIKHGVAHETPSLKTHTQAPSNMVLLMKQPPWKHTHRHHQTWCCSWNSLPENTHTGTIKHGVAHETPSLKTHTQAPSNMVLLMKRPPWKHTHRHHQTWCCSWNALPENTHTGTIKHGVAHETPSLKTHTQAPSNMVLLMKHLPENTHTGTIKHGVAHETPPWKHTHRHHKHGVAHETSSLKTHTQALSNMVLLMKHLPENTHTGTIKHGVAHETPPWKHTHRHHQTWCCSWNTSLKTHTQAPSNMVLLMKHLPENTHTGTIKQPASKVFL